MHSTKQIVLTIALVVVVLLVISGGTYLSNILSGVTPLVENVVERVGGQDEAGRDAPVELAAAEPFTISVFAEGLEAPRDLIRGPAGRLLVSVPSEGTVVALNETDADGRTEETETVISGLNRPHGLATYCKTVAMHNQKQECYLYVAETGAVQRFRYDFSGERFRAPEHLFNLPAGGRHFTRSLQFAPTEAGEKLFISVGSSCNVCVEEDERRAAILRADPDGSDLTVHATGLRNAVFMALQPVTGDLWATEMGRDWLGDDLPPDEINIIKKDGDYGWPYCYGKNVHDDGFDPNRTISCEGKKAAHINITPAHSSPLGIGFIPEEGWPESHWFDAVVALHGSWNRSEPSGYKVVRYQLNEEGTKVEGRTDLITGFLNENGDIIGRPVDVLIEPGGVMYISDDASGRVYRVIYTPRDS